MEARKTKLIYNEFHVKANYLFFFQKMTPIVLESKIKIFVEPPWWCSG